MSKKNIPIINFHTDLGIFTADVITIVGEDNEKILEYAKEIYAYDDCDTEFYGYTDVLNVPTESYEITFVTLYVRPYLTVGLIAHECYHVVTNLFDHIGVKDREAHAYTLEYLIEQQFSELKYHIKNK